MQSCAGVNVLPTASARRTGRGDGDTALDSMFNTQLFLFDSVLFVSNQQITHGKRTLCAFRMNRFVDSSIEQA
jgi:hypothetical protein